MSTVVHIYLMKIVDQRVNKHKRNSKLRWMRVDEGGQTWMAPYPPKAGVTGSNPVGRAIFFKWLGL